MVTSGGAPLVCASQSPVVGVRVCCGLFALGCSYACVWVDQVVGNRKVLLGYWFEALAADFGLGALGKYGGVV